MYEAPLWPTTRSEPLGSSGHGGGRQEGGVVEQMGWSGHAAGFLEEKTLQARGSRLGASLGQLFVPVAPTSGRGMSSWCIRSRQGYHKLLKVVKSAKPTAKHLLVG